MRQPNDTGAQIAGRWRNSCVHTVHVLIAGAALFAGAYLWFAAGPSGVAVLAPAFVLAGLGIGCAETAEHAAVAEFAPKAIRGSGFGFLAAVQSIGNLAASTIAGILWTAVSPSAAFMFLAGAMVAAVAVLGLSASYSAPRGSQQGSPTGSTTG
jgi:MFS family permease